MQVNSSMAGIGDSLSRALDSVARAVNPAEAAAERARPVEGPEARQPRPAALPDTATLAAADKAMESGRPTLRGSFVNLRV